MALILRLAPAALLCAVVQGIPLPLQGSGQSLPKREKPAASPAGGDVESWELRGTVVREDGKPAPQASITVRNSPFLKTIRPTADGSFVVTVPKPPSWNFAVFAQDENGSRRAAFLVDNSRLIKPSVSTVRLVLRKAREVTVLVTDNANRPVEGATVGMQSRYVTVEQQKTDRQGQTRLQFAASIPLQSVYAFKAGEGLDYCLYQSPDEWAANPYARAQDDAIPLNLKLAGARLVLVRVTQTGGQPVAGVSVRPWFFTLPKKGSILNLAGDAIVAVTDRDGKATFPQVPANNHGTIIFHLETQDYFVPHRLEFEPKSKSSEIAGVVAPWEHLRGKVIFANGLPGRGAKIEIHGGGYQSEPFTGDTNCDDEGRFEARVAPDQYVLFLAKSGEAISEVQTRVVRAGLPTKPLNLVMEPVTRVHGTVTVGKENRPVPRQQIVMTLGPPVSYDQLPNREQVLPKPEKSIGGAGGSFWERTTTDVKGRYELFVGPGKYRISGPSGGGTVELDVRVQPEIEHNFHSARPENAPLSGRVVLKSDPTRGIAGARVEAESVDPSRYGGFWADCDTEGKFRVRRNFADMLVMARSGDGRLAALARVPADDVNVTIPVGPCASAHGRLIDERTGLGRARQLVRFGIPIHYSGGMSITAFGGGTRTNSRGEFTLEHLTTGWKYDVQIVSESRRDHQPGVILGIGSVRAEKAETVDLGELEVDDPYNPPTLEDLVDEFFKRFGQRPERSAEPAAERLRSSLRDARLLQQRVLLFAAWPRSDVCRQFVSLYEQLAFTNDPALNGLVQSALANDAILSLNLSADDGADARSLLRQSKLTAPQAGEATIALLNSDGAVLAVTSGKQLSEATALSGRRLVEFLNSHAPPLPDAVELLVAARAHAKHENKRVLVHWSTPFSESGLLLARYLDVQKALLEKDYVCLRLDPRFPNFIPAIRSLGQRPESQLLFIPVQDSNGTIKKIPSHLDEQASMTILDADGKVLITSADSHGNIGFPGGKRRIDHFRKMIRETAHRLSAAEIELLIRGLEPAALQ